MDSKVAIKKLEELKNKIDKLSSEKRAAEIAITEMEKDLKENFDIDIKDLNLKIEELEKEIKEKESELQSEIERIENELARIES